MGKSLLLAVLAITALSCQAMRGPEPIPPQWQGATLYTCCNLHYERPEINDANYYVGSLLAFGSPAQVQKVTKNSVTIRSGATDVTLIHSYGAAQETSQQYFDKMLLTTDPHTTFDTYPKDVQSAIQNSRVEIGMTKPQVIMSLGYPATHRTASTDLNTWTYWYNRWVSIRSPSATTARSPI